MMKKLPEKIRICTSTAVKDRKLRSEYGNEELPFALGTGPFRVEVRLRFRVESVALLSGVAAAWRKILQGVRRPPLMNPDFLGREGTNLLLIHPRSISAVFHPRSINYNLQI
jgi:hypothetical protein